MAKVASATSGSLMSNSLQIGEAALKVGPMVKRKSPSELREEQLKRINAVEIVDESPAPLSGSTNNTSDNGLKKPDLPRNPRYIDTRMDEVYPIKKSRLRVLSVKENAKENISTEQTHGLKNISMLSNLAAKRQLLCPENSAASSIVSKNGKVQACQTIDRCNESIFRSVTELSSNGEKSSGIALVDMDKVLKGLVAHEPPTSSGLNVYSSEKFGNCTSFHSGNFVSECIIPGQKAPLDFTLKTKMRVTSSCSVNWIHRSIMCSVYNGMPQLSSQTSCSIDGSSSGQSLTSQSLSSKVLHSWIYPQSTLPPSVISVLSSQAAEGVEIDFLRKRQMGWEDSFRSLYYMLRKDICNIFYVCTSHFVVLFINSSGSGRTKNLCNAYISQSTRDLRSLLRKHDVYFSMPLCHSNIEQATTEDLVELSEIEKQNLGQTRRPTTLSDVDHSPQSLLAFCGNKNVHALYDFLLNYRSSLTFLSGVDVPVLYSPVSFQNAALSTPEIRCMEMKRVDHVAGSFKEFEVNNGEHIQGSSSGLRSSIEIKDAYIPLWIICRVCALIRSEGKSFEASFITERTSIGLNVALETICEETDSGAVASKSLQDNRHSIGIPEAKVSPSMGSSFVKGLKYIDDATLECCSGSCTYFLSWVTFYFRDL
ncbi:uncharacterized protein LOC110650472 isoform X1 [Hevea brasiliensis]|uniref:uncharacterized protein LOC110650472 isoform X1 n=1 Tax=Hevea brasiliensis TaxID=3981 RepID=UPI0025F9D986|nr:uncharacterized protein LOC110650472 isoform X1 [Hevea brasiliensis]XP_057999689.1 uncharacterized protein LOC110650472 isoform X1 [Hevea brasiliensis]XP_057999691.1 uncharacterized protein LOC110650472 isoform X1 [Hevea brasiliensis]XP_057999692.1 uncharacterized protein LOC110650472 isoform X1 [Hevea brasiliensis]